MVFTLYMLPISPPSRAVMMTAEALGLELDLKPVNLATKQHLTPEYLKLNPQHTIPTLDDNGTIIWDSHAIIAYLVRKYGKDDSLYPTDFAIRALVDQRLHFEGSVMFATCRRIIKKLWVKGEKAVSEDDNAEVQESYDFLNKFLEDKKWVAGDSVTVADISLVSSVTTVDTFIPVDKTKYPNVIRWLKDVSELPFYKVNEQGVKDFAKFINNILA